jgi:CheY-like chemotaxis protein
MRILVVDDDALAGEMTAAVLEEGGHDCVLAENGMEALGRWGGDVPFDMVISDMNMPLMSGIELFRELRAQGVNAPFILLSGDDPEVARAQEPLLDACLLKDFSLEENLPRVMADVLARR